MDLPWHLLELALSALLTAYAIFLDRRHERYRAFAEAERERSRKELAEAEARMAAQVDKLAARVDDLDAEVDKAKRWLSRLSESQKGQPSTSQMHELSLAMRELEGRLGSFASSLERIEKRLDRHDDWLTRPVGGGT